MGLKLVFFCVRTLRMASSGVEWSKVHEYALIDFLSNVKYNQKKKLIKTDRTIKFIKIDAIYELISLAKAVLRYSKVKTK